MTPTLTLADFLLARIAEDEAVAERCIERNRFGDVTSWHGYRHQLDTATLPRGAVAVPAPGFLAECEAKRQIVDRYRDIQARKQDGDLDERLTLGWVLGQMTLPYADHPDYRGDWKP